MAQGVGFLGSDMHFNQKLAIFGNFCRLFLVLPIIHTAGMV